MITELTRRDLIDLFNSFDPEPVRSMFADLGVGEPRTVGIRWWGRLNEPDFLARLYDLDAMPSQVPRYSTALQDIWQHRINNLDWDDDWVFFDERLGLANSDEKLLRFLAETLHPTVRSDRDEVERLHAEYNRILRADHYEIRKVSSISGRPVFEGMPAQQRKVPPLEIRKAIGHAIRDRFKAYNVEAYCNEVGMPPLPDGNDANPGSSKAHYVAERLAGCQQPELVRCARVVQERCDDPELEALLAEIDWGTRPGMTGAPKNIIFGSKGPKPDIVLVDAVNNDINVVRNAEHCLVYDRPINPDTGVPFQMLVDWWAASHPDDRPKPENYLHRRLKQGQNEAEQAIFDGYVPLLAQHGFGLPALIPQVYLHYDPDMIAQRAAKSGTALKRQRMDFLMLLPGRRRVVIELDGRHHYATDDGAASPSLYASMMAEDRRLRLAGYEVFRFGGHEFTDPTAGRRLATAFFAELLTLHGVLPK